MNIYYTQNTNLSINVQYWITRAITTGDEYLTSAPCHKLLLVMEY